LLCSLHLTPVIERSRSTLQVAENNDIFVAKYLAGVIVSVLQKLLAALNKRTEWGQVFILDALETLAKPKASSSVTPHPPTICSTATLALSYPPPKSPWVTSNL